MHTVGFSWKRSTGLVSPGKTSNKYCFNFTKKKRERDFSSIDPIKNPENAVEKKEKIEERERNENKDRKKIMDIDVNDRVDKNNNTSSIIGIDHYNKSSKKHNF